MIPEEKWLYFVDLGQPFEFDLKLETKPGMSKEAIRYFITGNSPLCEARIQFIPKVQGIYRMDKVTTKTFDTLDGPYTMPSRVLTRLSDGVSYNTHANLLKGIKNRADISQYFLSQAITDTKHEIIELTDLEQIINVAEHKILNPQDFFELGTAFGIDAREDDSKKLLNLLTTSNLREFLEEQLEEYKEQFLAGFQIGIENNLLKSF
jgi:hypothetical protein